MIFEKYVTNVKIKIIFEINNCMKNESIILKSWIYKSYLIFKLNFIFQKSEKFADFLWKICRFFVKNIIVYLSYLV